MEQKHINDNSQKYVRGKLKDILVYAIGFLEAVKIAQTTSDSVPLIKQELERVKNMDVQKSVTSLEADLASEERQNLYREGLLDGFMRVLEILTESPVHSSSIRSPISPLFRLSLEREGFLEGIRFAMSKENILTDVQSELQSEKDHIERQFKENPQGPMAPNASPRMYRDGYIKGLEKVLEIAMNG